MASSTPIVKGQVKGLLRGLRYISQMFDEQEGENDIQIGFPTDVKHLAHIGCDDSQSQKPTWMTEFKGPEEISSGSVAVKSNMSREDNKDNNGKVDRGRHHSRRSKHSSTENQSNSPRREQNSGELIKQRRHHRSSESSKKHHRHSNNNESGTEDEKLLSSSTKHSHRRKSKTSDDKEGSIRRSSKTTKKGSKENLLTESEVS
ncbi:unnamed protein product [Lupinus luteus]|uniref:CRIB domain-containing protein n=1 Tax=Lupinus luteus TaxID=3873 RepID=A0AAV1VSP0_LUPLU